MTPIAKQYGWKDSQPPCSTAYLLQPVLGELRRLGAKRVVDLGCGNGSFSHLIQQAGFEVVGCDADAEGIDIARQTQSGATFFNASFDAPAEQLGDARFDAAISTEVVEHLFEPRSLTRFATRVLKPGGSLIVTTPYHAWLKNTLIGLLGKWDAHHNPLTDGAHIKFWSYQTLSQLLTESGFTVERFEGAGRIPWLWKSMVLSARSRAAG